MGYIQESGRILEGGEERSEVRSQRSEVRKTAELLDNIGAAF